MSTIERLPFERKSKEEESLEEGNRTAGKRSALVVGISSAIAGIRQRIRRRGIVSSSDRNTIRGLLVHLQ